MVFENKIQVHNAVELIRGENGHIACRVPESVRQKMEHPDAPFNCTGIEFRFVIEEGNQATVRVHFNETDTRTSHVCALYLGNHQYGWQWLRQIQIVPGMNEITVTLPENMEELETLSKEFGDPFAARVVRLIMPRGQFEICDVEGNVRPPLRSELPSRYGVFYGSSITHGSVAHVVTANYVSLVTRALKIDSLNKGFGGACYMEPDLVDYVLSHRDAAFISVEVGTNCYGVLEDEELRRRVEYMIEQFKKDPAGRQLFVIDCLAVNERYDGCRQLVRDCVNASGCPDIHYVNGLSLLPNRQYLATDGIHPTLDGHIHIGQRYAEILRQYL